MMLTASRVAKRPWLWMLACVLLLQSACAMSEPGAARTKAVSSAAITRITLERNCFGCVGGSVLVLQRDDKAIRTLSGSARASIAEQRFEGLMPPRAFDVLARLLVEKNFFDLQDSYQDPALQDGAWATVRVEWGEQNKQVFSSNGAGPPSLRAIEQAIEAVQAQMRFVRTER
jgi:hypothetical protein